MISLHNPKPSSVPRFAVCYPKIRVKAAREMLYKFMAEKKVVLAKAGRDKIRSEVKERAPKFKLERKLFQTEFWIGGKLG